MTTLQDMTIQSYNGPYEVRLRRSVLEAVGEVPIDRPYHLIIDARVQALYAAQLEGLLKVARSVLPMEASENTKSLEEVPTLIRKLADNGVRRDHLLVAIGGGITQDLTCFMASILFRGMDWLFLPTTLLAQADSCIGSKSSINAAGTKNLVGNFYPPKRIIIAVDFLKTLDERDVRSGVGEMLKVHIIDGPESFDEIAKAYRALFTDPAVMLAFVQRSLAIKQKLIEIDEFDRGPRNVMNYGHSFGHAIEAATDFAVPHGIAVTMGADMANFVSTKMGRVDKREFDRMHAVLHANYRGYEKLVVPLDTMLSALGRDKKNVGADLVLILPDAAARIEKVRVSPDAAFREYCFEFLDRVRHA